MYAWRIAGLPWASKCDEELGRVHVVVTEPKEFTELALRMIRGGLVAGGDGDGRVHQGKEAA